MFFIFFKGTKTFSLAEKANCVFEIKMNTKSFNQKPAWKPDDKCGLSIKKFMKTIEQKYKLNFGKQHKLRKFTIDVVINWLIYL